MEKIHSNYELSIIIREGDVCLVKNIEGEGKNRGHLVLFLKKDTLNCEYNHITFNIDTFDIIREDSDGNPWTEFNFDSIEWFLLSEEERKEHLERIYITKL